MGLFRRDPTEAKIAALEDALERASSYEQWCEIAQERDQVSGYEAWRAEDESDLYDYQLIQKRLTELRRLREAGDVAPLVFFLHEGLHGNLGNMANGALFSTGHFGTKRLVAEYIEGVCEALNYVCDAECENFDLGAKLKFYKRTGMSFGRSALMLSGGATLGIFHLGVMKAMWDQGLLPRVITGSSAGAICAAAVGARAEDEIEESFQPETFSLKAWKSLGVMEAIRGGSIMDSSTLKECIRDNVGDLSFEEAFERSGRLINITVSPAVTHQQGRLLNYLTAPNVHMWSAALASSAIPGVFAPVELSAKDFNGEPIPYMPGRRWVDGSLRSDLPMLRVARMHNVNHYIVSQTNPHVLPFMNEKQARRGVLPFTRELMASGYTVYGKHVMDLAVKHFGGSTPGKLIGKLHSVTDQRYRGDITIYPTHTKYLLKAFSNPTVEDVRAFIQMGQRMTWPHLERIRYSTMISRTFEECLQRLKAKEHAQLH